MHQLLCKHLWHITVGYQKSEKRSVNSLVKISTNKANPIVSLEDKPSSLK